MTSLKANRDIYRLMAEYERDHQDATNRRLHFIAVPLIFFCVVAFLTEIPMFDSFRNLPGGWLPIAAIPASIYYIRRSVTAGVVMIAFTLLCFGIVQLLRYNALPVWEITLGLFVVFSGVQYVGHSIEGKRPSFYRDAQFLLIGPVWVFHKILSPLGVRY